MSTGRLRSLWDPLSVSVTVHRVHSAQTIVYAVFVMITPTGKGRQTTGVIPMSVDIIGRTLNHYLTIVG